ncbi:MAG: serine/threonine protein kinase [Deltaproteobacteria bacterium]|nr:serine/threonine protein kinase [Deltaproteobacteria bacterium]
MKVLCPECQNSVVVPANKAVLECKRCGLTVDLSQLGTSPGMAPIPVVRDLSGETLGGYVLEKLVGVGGMGVVYKGTRESDDSVVAVKILNSEYQWKRDEFIARFKREAAALKRLDHPNVVKLIDSGHDGDNYYLVTEFVEGMNLAHYLRVKTLEIKRIVDIMSQVCAAITYAHANGIVHRDIKPANIVISDDTVKVLDFGLAQMAGMDSQITTLTRTDLAMGTFNYLSPEQRTNAKDVDERSDIFSLGIVFFEMLTGTLPIGSFEPPSETRKDVPKKCNEIIRRSLNTDPRLRYQNVEAFRCDLLKLTNARLISRPGMFAGIAAAALLMGGMGAWMWPGEETAIEIVPAVEQASQKQTAQVPKQAAAPANTNAPPQKAQQIQQVKDTDSQQLEKPAAPKKSAKNDTKDDPGDLLGDKVAKKVKVKKTKRKKKAPSKSKVPPKKKAPPKTKPKSGKGSGKGSDKVTNLFSD